MSNITKFKNFLMREKIYMEDAREMNGTTFFRGEQKLKDGWKVMMVIGFSGENENIIDLFCFNVVEVKNPQKKAAVLEALNDINTNSRYTKIYIEEETVSLRYSYSVEGEFMPDVAFRKLVMLLETAQDVYPSLMDVIWS